MIRETASEVYNHRIKYVYSDSTQRYRYVNTILDGSVIIKHYKVVVMMTIGHKSFRMVLATTPATHTFEIKKFYKIRSK